MLQADPEPEIDLTVAPDEPRGPDETPPMLDMLDAVYSALRTAPSRELADALARAARAYGATL